MSKATELCESIVCVKSRFPILRDGPLRSKIFVFDLSVPRIPQQHYVELERVIPYCDIILGNETEAKAWANVDGLPDNNLGAVAAALNSPEAM